MMRGLAAWSVLLALVLGGCSSGRAPGRRGRPVVLPRIRIVEPARSRDVVEGERVEIRWSVEGLATAPGRWRVQVLLNRCLDAAGMRTIHRRARAGKDGSLDWVVERSPFESGDGDASFTPSVAVCLIHEEVADDDELFAMYATCHATGWRGFICAESEARLRLAGAAESRPDD